MTERHISILISLAALGLIAAIIAMTCSGCTGSQLAAISDKAGAIISTNQPPAAPVADTSAPTSALSPQPSALSSVFPSAKLRTCPASVSTWPEVSSLTVTRGGGRLIFSTDKPELWPNIDGSCGQIVCLLYRDGQWQGGPCDALHPFNTKTGQAPPKKDDCACVPQGDQRLFVPIDGEEVRFVVVGRCRNGVGMAPKQRTAEAVIKW